MRAVLARLVGLFRSRRLDAELDAEVSMHLELATQDYMRRGMSASDARAAAIRNFGGVIQMKEQYREQRGLPFIETFLQDARYGVRALLRTKGFTAAALLTLALGIGANSAIFSVVNAVLLKPLNYPEPERIVLMHRNVDGFQWRTTGRRFMFWRDNMKSVDAVAAWRGTAFNVASGDTAEYVDALAVSKEYFTVFGGIPLHGRLFLPEEDLVGGPDVAILGHDLWRRMFASDPGIVGKSIALGDRAYTVVGVMPDGFDEMRTSELFVPLRPSTTGPGGGFNYTVAARLRKDVPLSQANAESATIFEAYKAAVVSTNPKADFSQERATVFLPYQESVSRDVKPALLMILGAVGMLLLIACANTANLLLARASGRGRELSVRAALGAGRGRIVRQLLTESIILFITGGLLGVALAYWTVPALVAMTPPGFLPGQAVRVDATVLVATLALSLITGLAFGLAPAISLSRRDLVGAFKDDGTRTTASRRSGWARGALVVAEVSLCTVLLLGASLLVQTFLKLRAVDPGFDGSNVITARMSLAGERYNTAADVNRLYDLGIERLKRLPGVQSVAVVNGVPMEWALNLNVDFMETPEVEVALTDWRYATTDYFRTMAIPIVKGRGFDETDRRGSPPVAVVSEEFARRFYKGENPLGRRIRVFSSEAPMEIVGVVRDLREHTLTASVPAVMYVPVAQTGDAGVRTSHMYFQVTWVIRTANAPPELAQRIRDELRSVDPRQPVTAVRSIAEIKSRAMATETFQMTLLTIFAAIGLLLAGAGIYGLVAYSVGQRTREFGIRMALGARPGEILRSIIARGAALALFGVAVGSIAAALGAKWLQTFLFEVSTHDPKSFVIVGAILVAVAALASLVPALRAVRLNPVSALRE